jgi:hypothetical protein
MRREKRVHVVKRGEKWAIWKQEKSRASRIYNKKEDAIEAGIELTEQGWWRLNPVYPLIHSLLFP